MYQLLDVVFVKSVQFFPKNSHENLRVVSGISWPWGHLKVIANFIPTHIDEYHEIQLVSRAKRQLKIPHSEYLFTLPRQTRLSCLVCVASDSAFWIGFLTTQDCCRQRNWSLNMFRSIVQFTLAHQTRHRTVLSCMVWRCELSRPTTRQVRSASECVGRRRHCLCDRRTHSDAERTCQTVGRTQFTPPDTTQTYRVRRAVWIEHKLHRPLSQQFSSHDFQLWPMPFELHLGSVKMN